VKDFDQFHQLYTTFVESKASNHAI